MFGYDFIFITSLLEGIFIAGFFVPGTAVIMLGATFASQGQLELPLVILSGLGGLLIGHLINYWIGREGWYRLLIRFGQQKRLEEAKKTLASKEQLVIFLGYMFTGTGVLLTTAAGIIQLPFRRFYINTIFAQTVWTIFWATLAYIFGTVFVNIVIAFSGVLVFALLLALVVKIFLARKKK